MDEMDVSEHLAQFYETDAFLLTSLADYIGGGLRAGEAVMVVATEAHRTGLEGLLRESGLDLNAVKASGQYLALDAAETLSQFMVEGLPDPERFTEVVGGLIERAAQHRPGMRIFGEMVALLWESENYEGAIQLEALWNELQKEYSFSLLCAYSMNECSGEARIKPFRDVCAQHSGLMPADSYLGLSNQDARLRAIVELQRKSISLEAEIKERQTAEQRLLVALTAEQLARAEAESANRLKDEFLTTVSHELRTPLNAIIGWSQMLLAGNLDEATGAYALKIIDRNARMQAQMVEDIIDVARVISGKLSLDTATVDVAAVIDAAVDATQLAADSKNIQLEVVLDRTAHHVLGDFGRLQQVVWNLISNAIKFTPAGGHVEVRVTPVNDSVEIKVSDNGEGISSDFLPFVFGRFRQADGSQTRLYGGLGLGLAIVRHLVELHGGTVRAESRGLGCGATFTINLPLRPPKRSRITTRRSRDRGRDRTKLTHSNALPMLDGVQVLLVDDDPEMLQMLTVLLSDYRARVQAVTSPVEALAMLQDYQPDVLVLDLSMPQEDGYSLIRKIRAAEARGSRETPAVALTGHVRVEDRARALSAGFNLFVPKPVEPGELITAIANLAGPQL